MSSSSVVVLAVLVVLVLVLGPARSLAGRVVCADRCCSFIEGVPLRLKELRSSFSKIRDSYGENDQLDSGLIDNSLEQYLESPFGCHALDDMFRFYLDTVLPAAVRATEENEFRSPLDSIGNIFTELKKEMVRCRKYFACKNPFDITKLISTYKTMESQGLDQAMGELDLFFNYIEKYLASKRQKN